MVGHEQLPYLVVVADLVERVVNLFIVEHVAQAGQTVAYDEMYLGQLLVAVALHWRRTLAEMTVDSV